MQKKEYNDLWVILNNMYSNREAMLPQKYLDFVQSSMVPDYVSKIDPDVDLERQSISEETRNLLAALLLTYWAENTYQRRLFAEHLHANEMKFQGKPDAEMTEEEYQDLLAVFDDWNELFGPIPFWAVSRHWYPNVCYQITDNIEEAEIKAGNTGLIQVEVSREERDQILEEARQWVLVKKTHEVETYYWHDNDTETWDSSRDIEDYYHDFVVIKDKHFYGAMINSESVSSFGMSVNKFNKWGIICIDGTKDGETEEYYHHSSTEVSVERDTVYSLRKKAG